MMTIKEHLDNFMRQPDVVRCVDLYENILLGNSDKWLDI